MTRAKPKPKRQNARRSDSTPVEVIAAALVEADAAEDADVARRYGVAAGTIHTWRTRVATDDELEQLVMKARRKRAATWRDEAAETLIVLTREMRRRVAEGVPLDFPLIAGVTKVGAICVESSALLGDEPDDPPPAPPPAPLPPPKGTPVPEVHH